MWTGIKRIWKYLFFTAWQHVGLFEHEQRFEQTTWKVYIHCYESQYGDRDIEIVGALSGTREAITYDKDDFESLIRITPLYQKELYPWLKGRAHRDIPGYAKVKSKKSDFTRRLKDQDPIVLKIDENA